MTMPHALRWGILGTAHIAEGGFLPALREVGGIAAAVAGRDAARAQQYAAEHGIGRWLQGYQSLVDDPDIDALYIPLPNSLHAEWTIRALQAGRPVLCEKPLCGTRADTERVLSVARQTGTLLWEAFVFPFHQQLDRVRLLLAQDAIGELREVQSNCHFLIGSAADIRMSAELEGGALRDVGCYPVRLAQELFGEHESAWGGWDTAESGVDIETWGSLSYPGGGRLMLSSGFRRRFDRFTRLLGSAGQIHLTNPFHPGPSDQLTLYPAAGPARTFAAEGGQPPFTAALRHISAAISGAEPPRLLAVETSLATASALADLAASAAGRPSHGAA